MSVGHICLALFLIVESWHLGLSMELAAVGWIGSGLAILGASRAVTVERPSWGLLFVLFSTGALAGSQIIEDWALEDSWPRNNGLGAGIIISVLLYQLWVFAARERASTEQIIERSSKTLLVWGLFIVLMITPSEAVIVTTFGLRTPVTAFFAVLLACLALLADRCGDKLGTRLVLLLPVLLMLPLSLLLLERSQDPVISALNDLLPRSREFNSTGFAPYQTLRASAFLRPSNDPVMRIRSDAPPSNYLVGNRLVTLSEGLLWLSSEQSLRSFSTVDAELLDSNQWRYPVENHHYSAADTPPREMTLHSLSSDDYLFVTPGTTSVAGRFTSISRNAADAWTPDFDRGTNPRWQLATGGRPTADAVSPDTLTLPGFWDEALQDYSAAFAGGSRQETAENIVSYFQAREYTLETSFDPERPFHDFLLNDRAGYCFWFASATALALRANGIPSRIVGGYLMHEQISEDLWLVRERDAHSWVEWQDDAGYWHTADPTPPSITAFFGGYQTSRLSQLYHTLAGQWQLLFEKALENRAVANLITYGGLAVLLFLFAREYSRLRRQQEGRNEIARRWQGLWERFLKITGLPRQSGWTASEYASRLPADWREEWRDAVLLFLRDYETARFSRQHEQNLASMEKSLTLIARQRK